MKKVISLILVLMLVLSSSVVFAKNNRQSGSPSYNDGDFSSQISQLEELLKRYHENEQERKWLIKMLTEYRNLSDADDEEDEDELTVYINGVEFNCDESADVTYKNISLPIDLIKKGLGASLSYNKRAYTLSISQGDKKIAINFKTKSIRVNNSEIKPSILSKSKTSTTIQLIKFIAETLGHRVEIDENEGVVTIEGNGNLAARKTAYSDGEQYGNSASYGNDENTGTRWCAADGGLNHWWKVDLGGAYDLSGSEIKWEFNKKVYKYKIEVSQDNSNWTLVVDKTGNSSNSQTQKDYFTAKSARYVRVTVTGLDAGAWASFYEFKVFGNLFVGSDTIAPVVPDDLSAYSASTSQINLSWKASKDNTNVAGYKVYRNGTQIGSVSGTSYNDSGLSAGTQYTYTVAAYDTAGNTSPQCTAVQAATLASTESGNGLKGEYYDNTDLTSLKLTRVDPRIEFNWGGGTPDPSINKDTFSVRWTGQILPLYSEEYTFHSVSDDGIRLWVNGSKIIDNWTQHGATVNFGKIKLIAGQKVDIKLEYYDQTKDSEVKLSWSSPSVTKQVVPQSQLFTNSADTQVPSTPTGLTAVTASASQINLSWAASTDNYGVAGYRVYRNGSQIATVTSGTAYVDSGLTAGISYSYTVLAYDAAGNQSAVSSAVSGSTVSNIGNGNGLTGEYFDGVDFITPKAVRTDAKIDFSWNGVAPVTGVGKETYSVRWTGQLLPEFSQEYTFYTHSDDGVRLWVNGNKIIDNWTEHSLAENQGKISLTAGQKVDIKLEYYQNKTDAAIKLYWSSASQAKEIIPQGQLFSNLTDTQAPTVPAGLTVTPESNSQLNLSWTASSDAFGVAGYKVFRNGNQVAIVINDTKYLDKGLAQGTSYSYTVIAYDAAGNNSPQSAAVSGTTQNAAAVNINDNTTGTGLNQFNYSGNWSYGSQNGAYSNDNHWSSATDDYYSVLFDGTQCKLYAAKDPSHGIAEVYIDGVSQGKIDLYASSRSDNTLIYTSSVLAKGQHTVKVKVTGTRNSSAGNCFIPADRIEIINN